MEAWAPAMDQSGRPSRVAATATRTIRAYTYAGGLVTVTGP
jgi:hypothetical protein